MRSHFRTFRRTLLVVLGAGVLLATSEASTVIDESITASSGETVVVRVVGEVSAIDWSQISIADASGAGREATLRPVSAPDLEGDTIVRWHPLCRNISPCTQEFVVVGPQSSYTVDVVIEDSPASGGVISDATTLTLSLR